MTSKKVLIVDDSRTMRNHLAGFLTIHGYVVVEAEDGLDALQKLRDNTDVAVIIADINMPRMNGIDMLIAIKNEPGLPTCPIVMLTTETNTEMIAKARSHGARGWIVKPVEEQQLLTIVTHLTK